MATGVYLPMNWPREPGAHDSERQTHHAFACIYTLGILIEFQFDTFP
jgi:hypothetical protein